MKRPPNKTLSFALQFSAFVSEHCPGTTLAERVEFGSDLAHFSQVANQRAQVATKACNVPDTDGKIDQQDEKLIAELKEIGRKLGFDNVTFPGLYPTLHKGEKQFHPPID